MNKFILGGFLSGKRTYIISGVGILSALAAFAVGDINVFEMLNTVYPLAAIYFLRKGIDDKKKKGKKNANTRKISK